MRDKKARWRTLSIPAALALGGLVAACSGTATEGGSADTTVAGTVHVCSSCHGPEGRSISPTFPRLAGQQKDYLVAQLQAFRDKTRADPHAQTYMWGMAARLSDPTIDGIAAYYAAQTPVAGQPSQLEAFASMARANEIMHENSKDLTPEQIAEVTAYLATL